MKKALILIISFLFLACSDDDSNEASLDTNLLFGQWYNIGLCHDQNSLLLNSNKTYVGFSSGAIDCDDPEPDTYRTEGTFELNGNFIEYSQTDIELVIDGTILSVPDIFDPNIKYEVTNLTATNLTIRVFRESPDFGDLEELGTYTYEH